MWPVGFSLLSACYMSSVALAQLPRVTVVGAGLSGLTAAYELEKKGFAVQVLEARKRLGGRVFTTYIGNEREELGGKCIDDGGNGTHIRSLMSEFQLRGETYNLQVATVLAPFRDGIKPDAELFDRLTHLALTADHLAQILDPFFPPASDLRKIIDQRMTRDEGRDVEELSPYYLKSFWLFYQDMYHKAENASEEVTAISYPCTSIENGNSKLIEALEKALKNPVKIGYPVRKVMWSKTDHHLVISSDHDHEVLESDILIFTIPPSVLKDIDIDEQLLTRSQFQAITNLQMGTNAKILIPVENSMKKKPLFEYSEEQMAQASTWMNKDGSILTLYFGGRSGVFDSERIAGLIDDERPFSKSDIPFTPGDSLVMSWIHEEFSKGSYSCVGPGQEKTYSEIAMEEGEQIRKLYATINHIAFAGEHTAVENPSTLEGSVESGRSVSKRMINKYLNEVNPGSTPY